jgi:hypothetical protein
MYCPICGKRRNLLASLLGTHRKCARIQAEEERRRREEIARAEAEAAAKARQGMLQQINRGEFKNLNSQAEMLLNPGETCCMVVKGTSRADFYPRIAGRPARAIRGALASDLRVDGLVRKDIGTLHVTTERVCFVGRGGARTMPLKKVVQCELEGDAIHLSVEGRAAASYFILEYGATVELAAAAIRKLASMARSNEKPTIVL